MPYRDASRQREAVRMWRATHPEKVQQYKKESAIKRAVSERKLPSANSIQHHRMSRDEVVQIVEALFG